LKRILAIFKDLQDSGQPTAIIGHFSIQTGNFQEVTNIDNVHERTETALSETDEGKNTNRYTTEQEQNSEGDFYPVSGSAELQTDLLEVIDAWQNLPDSIRAGIVAIVKATTARQG
jgi:hypothetical protein